MASTGEAGRLDHRPTFTVRLGPRWQTGGDLRVALIRVALIGAWAGALVLAAWATLNYVLGGWLGEDSHAYWLAGRVTHPYGGTPGDRDAFLYSPLFAQAMRLVAWAPWPVFFTGFAVASSAAFWWLARPLPWRWRVPVLLICWTEVLTGNVSAFLAVALVLGLTRGEALVLPALTKVTPGGVGLLWHLARGDWRQVRRAALVGLLLVAISVAVSPQLWADWFHFLTSHAAHGQRALGPRVLAGMALAVYAARTGRPVLLAVAFWLAMPMGGFSLLQPMSVLVAAVRLHDASAATAAASRRSRPTRSAVSRSAQPCHPTS